MTSIAILIAHKHDPENDKALAIALDCIVRNTRNDYELLVDTDTPGCPYRLLNRMVDQTSAEYVVFSNSDIFFAPGWDVPMINAAAPDVIITGVVVEPGAIGVNVLNHEHNFGMTPDTFDRATFEQWVVDGSEIPDGDGWYFPSLHNRQEFLALGGFDLSRGTFPEPLDTYYWQRWREGGRRVQRVKSFSYHLQQYSFKEEQDKAVRHAV